ncbi:hypothetical protein ACWE6V_004707 [Escherichia coli]
MLPISQLKSPMAACPHFIETTANLKSEITLQQLEEARESGCLHVKN